MALIIAKIPQEGYKYILTSQRDEKDPFVVWVKPISSNTLLVLEDGVVSRKNEEVYLSSGMFSFKVLQKSLVAWEGITDSDGDAIKIKRNSDGTATEETISYIGSEGITEIANVVAAISRNSSNVQIFFPSEIEEEVQETPKKVKAKALPANNSQEPTEPEAV